MQLFFFDTSPIAKLELSFRSMFVRVKYSLKRYWLLLYLPAASVSHQEITPSGHLYYVLDPSEKSPQRKNSDSPPRLPPARSPSYSASPPPLPNHHTPSNSAKSSPAHQSNDSTHDDDIVGTRSSRLQSSPVMTSRPKSHSHSLIGRSKGGQGDVSPAKKGSSLGRIKS